MSKQSKRMAALRESISSDKLYAPLEAIKLLKENAKVKFDESVEIAINLGIDPRHSDQQVRGRVSLPNGTGKTVRIAVFAKGEKAEEAKKAGADVVGAEDLMEKIQSGWLEFDRCIATPDMMGLVGRVGKILGPKNLMPNPKLGTVTPQVEQAIQAMKGGDVTYRAEKSGIVHALIGKSSFKEEALVENFNSFVAAIQSAKPTGAKGTYINRISLSTTMGVGLRVDLSAL